MAKIQRLVLVGAKLVFALSQESAAKISNILVAHAK